MSKEHKKYLYLLVLTLMVIPLLVACKPDEPPAVTEAPKIEETEPPPPPPPPEPTELKVGTTSIWDGLNLGVEVSGWLPYRLVFDSIVEFGASGAFIPGLAETWSVDSSGLVWTFKIQEGVTFHDGTPCTAEEIAWSLTWMEAVGFDSIAYMWAGLFEEVVALDATTLQITTATPLSYMEYILSYSFVVPKSVWGEIADNETMAAYTEEDATVGTGPFKFVEWVPDEYLILEANEDYWGGKPAIDRYIFQQYATEDAMVQALLGGEIDGISFVPATGIETLEAEDNITVSMWEGWGVDELTINSSADGTQPESLGDPVVRLAMEYAIDRQQINEVVYLGTFTPATTFIAPVLGDWHNSDVEGIPFDIAMANSTLEDAGYTDSDGDGVREWSDGTPLQYRFLIDDSASSARLAEVIKNGFTQAGIDLEISAVDYNSQLNAVFYYYDYDLTYWYWGADPDPDFLGTVFWCEQLYWWNDSGYCDEDYDALYTGSRAAIKKEDRKDLVWQMQEKIYNDRPWIILLYGTVTSAYRSDLFTGFSPEARYLFGKWSILQVMPVQ